MTPHQGQGGTQAVEDAEALHYLLGTRSVTREDVPRLLADFDRVRRIRAGQIQNNTREAHERKDADTLYKHSLYNWSYPGIKKCLENLDAGKPMIEV
jgi:salicylate hydroxylase